MTALRLVERSSSLVTEITSFLEWVYKLLVIITDYAVDVKKNRGTLLKMKKFFQAPLFLAENVIKYKVDKYRVTLERNPVIL